MAVNPSVYGDPSDWLAIGGREAWDAIPTTPGEEDPYKDSDIVKVAYFGSAIWSSQNLTLGNSQGKTVVGTAINKSISYCGLGTESAFSHIRYFDMLSVQSAQLGAAIAPFYIEERNVTDFSFVTSTRQIPGSAGQHDGYFWFSDGIFNGYGGNTYRWSPDGSSDLTNNISGAVVPFTSFSFKNFILLIRVKACATFDTLNDGTPQDAIDLPLAQYIANESDVRTNHPRIYSVYVVPYSYRTTLEQRSALPLTQNNALGVAILNSYEGAAEGALGAAIYNYGYGLNNAGNIKIHGMFTGGTNYQPYQYGFSNPSEAPHSTYGFLGCFPGSWQAVKTLQRDGNYNIQAFRMYGVDFDEECKAAVACFGCFFTDKLQVALTGDLDDPDMYCGTLESGVGHGKYTKGDKNKSQPQYSATTNETGYTPGGGGDPGDDPNIYGVGTSFNAVSLKDGTLKRYVLNDTQMDLLNKYLWDVIDTTDPDALIQDQTLTNFLTNNPLDCIVGIKRFPFADISTGTLTNIRLGKVTVPNTSAYGFQRTTTTLTCGRKQIMHYFNDWRDYICQFTLVLPFCGSINLPPEVVVGRTIEVKYSIDYTTGTCTAWVLCQMDDGSETVIDSACGNCSIDIPVSGVQTATLNADIYNANENLKAMKFNNMVNGVKQGMETVNSFAQQNWGGAARDALDLGQTIVNAAHNQSVADWNMRNTQIPTKMIGASSGCNSFQHELRPRLIVYKPRIDDTNPDNPAFNQAAYAHSVGYACCESATISEYSGYAEITNVDLSGFAATAAEKEMIKSLLASGVYL